MDTQLFAGIATTFAAGVLGIWGIVRKAEIDKRTPETITHQCRLMRLDVFTFIKESKKQTPPLCPYLDPSDYETCRFSPKDDRPDALEMKKITEDKCYIALFNNKFELR